MKVFAIGDLHLAQSVAKPMAIFGGQWENHIEKIKEAWETTVSDEDLVILCGDLSWAMRFHEAEKDLGFIDALPGYKICIRGNHDYWWEKITKLNTMYESIYFLQNTSFQWNGVTICGTRGWLCPTVDGLAEEDEKIYVREGGRLKLSLEDAKKKEAATLIVALHYPPTATAQEATVFTELMEAYGVDYVVYGHLHDETSWQQCLMGEKNGTSYQLVAADDLDFKPYLLMEL
ncbi:MAG: metallophosphoesterase [Cellulosilyticaceae bacterium]